MTNPKYSWEASDVEVEDESDAIEQDGGCSESETLPLPPWPAVPHLDHKTDYELIEMYKGSRDSDALLCLAHRYEGLAYSTCRHMLANLEYNDMKQMAFLSLIGAVDRINLNRINPRSLSRCLYLWYRQSLLNDLREYRKQLGDVREGKDAYGDKTMVQVVGYDDEVHSLCIGRDETGMAMAKMELWDLLDEDEAHVVGMYISGVKLADQAKRSSLYRLLTSAKTKIAKHYAKNNLIINL